MRKKHKSRLPNVLRTLFKGPNPKVFSDRLTSSNFISLLMSICIESTVTPDICQDPEYFAIRTWLTPPRPEYVGEYYQDEYKRLLDFKIPGTCLWIKKEKLYNDWHGSESPGSLLWICGPLGSGKSVVMASIIEELQSTLIGSGEIPVVLFFFCNNRVNDEHRNTAVAVIRSLVFQLWTLTRDTPLTKAVWKQTM